MRAWWPLLLFAACGPLTAPGDGAPATTSRSAIIGGDPAPGDTGIFQLLMTGAGGETSRCTATLIAPRTLLTAAHCADPVSLNFQGVSITAINDAVVPPGHDGGHEVTYIRLHHGWSAGTLKDDLALLLLKEPDEQTPLPWNRRTLSAMGGQPLRALGYGVSEAAGGGTGTRRTVDLTLRQLRERTFDLGDQGGRGICYGDSGGPSLMRFDGGPEEVVGVHSFTRSDECVDGADTRVDVYAGFIIEFLDEFEELCGADGLCSARTCAGPDPDCLAPGAPCLAAWECAGRVCEGDPERSAYCRMTCEDDDDCGETMVCDRAHNLCRLSTLPLRRPAEACTPGEHFCTHHTVCGGRDASDTRCRPSCAVAACQAPLVCEDGVTGSKVCVPPPVLLPHAGTSSLRAACATSPVLVLPLVVLLGRRRFWQTVKGTPRTGWAHLRS